MEVALNRPLFVHLTKQMVSIMDQSRQASIDKNLPQGKWGNRQRGLPDRLNSAGDIRLIIYLAQRKGLRPLRSQFSVTTFPSLHTSQHRLFTKLVLSQENFI
jgi:hypothetical protein